MKDYEFCRTEFGTIVFESDSDCNTGFYDSIGAERLGSEEMVCAGERLIVYAYRLC